MAIYPSGVSSNSDLYVALDNFSTTLNGAITNAQTTITLTSTVGLPTVGILSIESEKIRYTGISGSDVTGCTRGFSSTSAASHANATYVAFNVVEEHHNVLKDEVIAIETDLNAKLGTSGTAYTANRALQSNGSGVINVSNTTATELDYVSGVTSSIQTQLNAKAANTESFVTIGNTTGLTSERSLTGTTNQITITDNGANSSVVVSTPQDIHTSASPTFSSVLHAAGTVGAPSVSFTGATTTGVAQQNSGSLLFAVPTSKEFDWYINSVQKAYLDVNQFALMDGTVSLPAVSFTDDFDSGLYRIGTNNIAIATNGVKALEVSSAQAVSIRGTATTDSAAAGFVGEYTESVVSTFTNTAATGVFSDLTSISLTAGDWDVTGVLEYFRNTATWTGTEIMITSTSGNSTAGAIRGQNRIQDAWASSSTTPEQLTQTIPSLRVSLSSTTTYYLKIRANFSAGQPQAIGNIFARRIR